MIKTEIKKIKNFVAKTSSSKNHFHKIHLIDYPLVAITTITTISISFFSFHTTPPNAEKI